MTTLSRRGFLGVMSVVPVLEPAIGAIGASYQPDGDSIERALTEAHASDEASETEVSTPLAFTSQRSLRGAVGLRLMHKTVRRLLRDMDLRRVGGNEHILGDHWGSGRFTKSVYLKLPNAERTYDPLAFESLAAQFAQRIRDEGILRIGLLPLMKGTEQCCVHDDKRRLAMRYIEYFEIRVNSFIGRFDVLGGPA